MPITLRRVGVRELRARQDSGDGDARLQALLAEGDAFESWEGVALGGAVDGCVFEDVDAAAC